MSQCPFTDGLTSARALGARGSLKLLPYVAGDLAAKARGADPVMLPLAGPPGSPAMMNAPDALPGYEALIPAGTTFVNAAARVVPTLARNRPGRAAKKVTMPILFCVADHDTVTPPGQTIRYARRAPHAEIKTYDAGHFAFYLGDTFEHLVADQTAFLTRRLHELGIGPGDVVAVKLRNHAEFVLVPFAAWRLGATVAVTWPVGADELEMRRG